MLELGGSDPYIILEDADLDLAVDTCVTSRLINGGQSCIAAKRFIVVPSIRKEFESRFVEKMKSKKMGDPLQEGVDLGPQAARRPAKRIAQASGEKRRKRRKPAARRNDPGHPRRLLCAPRFLRMLHPGCRLTMRSCSGRWPPSFPRKMRRTRCESRMIRSSGWDQRCRTKDAARGERIARDELEAGSCFVNAFVKSDPRLPFGGIKESGYGRELSVFGIREFVNVKTVYIAKKN